MHFMAEKTRKLNPLRLTAAAILGIIVGAILFFVVAIVIGIFNDMYGMNLPLRIDVAENVWSLILLFVFIVLGIAGFCWKVRTTPPMQEEPVLSVSEE
jgi:hypothetical protein